MSKRTPLPTPGINRLRAAAALIPIIETGLAESTITAERAALMASFCEWSAGNIATDAETVRLTKRVASGLQRLKIALAQQAPGDQE
jgi:hypothetical protein